MDTPEDRAAKTDRACGLEASPARARPCRSQARHGPAHPAHLRPTSLSVSLSSSSIGREGRRSRLTGARSARSGQQRQQRLGPRQRLFRTSSASSHGGEAETEGVLANPRASLAAPGETGRRRGAVGKLLPLHGMHMGPESLSNPFFGSFTKLESAPFGSRRQHVLGSYLLK